MIRRQVAADLEKLRRLNLAKNAQWLSALRDGYKITGNKEGVRWSEDEIIRQFPYSTNAMQFQKSRWDAENPSPAATDTENKKQAYQKSFIK